jgi:hypothetical protein
MVERQSGNEGRPDRVVGPDMWRPERRWMRPLVPRRPEEVYGDEPRHGWQYDPDRDRAARDRDEDWRARRIDEAAREARRRQLESLRRYDEEREREPHLRDWREPYERRRERLEREYEPPRERAERLFRRGVDRLLDERPRW